MKILAIETSCDETAISIIEAKGGHKTPQFKIIADTIISQVELHKEYGGVFPSLAKREHTKNLLPILITTLKKAKILTPTKNTSNKLKIKNYKLKICQIMDREPELAQALIDFINKNKIPKIDAIAVTYGPGLEPALWTGLNFAKALALLWNKPFIPVNHMEGHLVASLLKSKVKNKELRVLKFPALGLLISGGHTQLVLMKDFNKFKIIGQTRDDAVGEAYDKVARMLGLEYPGGPQVSALAETCADSLRKNAERRRKQIFGKAKNLSYKLPTTNYQLPRPMLNTPDFDFSFSGLKTAVLYKIKEINPKLSVGRGKLTPTTKKEISKEFEDAVSEVLIKKTQKAIQKFKPKTLILGGGVVANKKLRKDFRNLSKKENIKILIPEIKYTGDNATMIAVAGYFRYLNGQVLNPDKTGRIKANGNLQL